MQHEYETKAAFDDNFRQTLATHHTEIQFEMAKTGSTTFESNGRARIGRFIFSMIEGEPLGKESGNVRKAKQQIKLHKGNLYDVFLLPNDTNVLNNVVSSILLGSTFDHAC